MRVGRLKKKHGENESKPRPSYDIDSNGLFNMSSVINSLLRRGLFRLSSGRLGKGERGQSARGQGTRETKACEGPFSLSFPRFLTEGASAEKKEVPKVRPTALHSQRR